jgi:hypothetical protein
MAGINYIRIIRLSLSFIHLNMVPLFIGLALMILMEYNLTKKALEIFMM